VERIRIHKNKGLLTYTITKRHMGLIQLSVRRILLPLSADRSVGKKPAGPLLNYLEMSQVTLRHSPLEFFVVVGGEEEGKKKNQNLRFSSISSTITNTS